MPNKDKRRPITFRPWTFMILGAITLILAAGCGNGGPDNGSQQGPPPPPVTVLTVKPEDVSVEAEYAGRVRGSREVEVRARVAGILEQRIYKEGSPVQEGEPLFRIDPEPFAIALQRAEADQAAALADRAQARREWQRSANLYQEDAISQRERDQARTTLELAEARLALAEAALADARRNLRYTEVAAPGSGITGLESFSEGSLIEPGTLLTTITSHDPVHVRFSLPENDAALLARQALARDGAKQPLEAFLRLAADDDYPYPGVVDFTDRVIDPLTGTVTARAIFANPDRQLVPGQLVRIRLLLQRLDGVFLIPPAAVGSDRNGQRVFVVGEDDTVQLRPVELGPVVAGRQVILSGLAAGDRLVINGQVALGPGLAVMPIPAEQED
jgi:membrane fusion protein, multidrug efflux system